MASDTARKSSPRPRRLLWIIIGLLLSLGLGGGAFAVDRYLGEKRQRQAFHEMVSALEEPALVLVTRDRVYLDGQIVGSARALARGSGPRAPKLFERLVERRYRHNMVSDQIFHRQVSVCAVEQTPFKAIRRVLRTAGMAGFADQRLGMPESAMPRDPSQVTEEACTQVELNPQVEPESVGPDTPPEVRVRIFIRVGADGIRLWVGTLRKVLAKKAGELDLRALGKHLTEVRQRLPGKEDLAPFTLQCYGRERL